MVLKDEIHLVRGRTKKRVSRDVELNHERALVESGYADRSAPAEEAPSEHREVHFVSFVLGDVQRTLGSLLPRAVVPDRYGKLVLFGDGVQSGHGG